jgi:hypothetical protein
VLILVKFAKKKGKEAKSLTDEIRSSESRSRGPAGLSLGSNQIFVQSANHRKTMARFPTVVGFRISSIPIQISFTGKFHCFVYILSLQLEKFHFLFPPSFAKSKISDRFLQKSDSKSGRGGYSGFGLSWSGHRSSPTPSKPSQTLNAEASARFLCGRAAKLSLNS